MVLLRAQGWSSVAALVGRGAFQRTLSHWYWGDYLELDADGSYPEHTADGREVRLDMTTGRVQH